jgi:hypothetical protein
VRLNKRIFAVVREELLADPETRAHLPVELNPTLHPEGEQWRFLAAAGEHEIFQRVPRGPVLDLFATLLDGRALPLGELERRLGASGRVDATADEVAAYAARLLEIGFLRFSLGIGEQEADWDRPLGRLLAAVPGELAVFTRRLLERLRAGRDELEGAGVERRRALIGETTAVMRETFPRLFERASLRTDVPFYEDAGSDAALDLPRDGYRAAMEELGEWVRLTSRLAWPRHDQATMRLFFDRRYDGAPVPLLRFYEDYYREHLKGHLEQVIAVRRDVRAPAAGGDEPEDETAGAAPERPDVLNPFGLEMIERIRAANDGLESLVRARWVAAPDAPELILTAADVAAAVAGVPEPAWPCHSVSAFVQTLPGLAGGGGALLVSNLLQGFGKYFSRFLHVLPDELHRTLAANNDRLTGELLAEISADGAYNANLHPPLLRWGVSYPTGEHDAAQGRLAVAELAVEPLPGDPHALCLRHRPSGRRVVALDLGFLNPRMRPPLFQLLINFAPAPGYTLQVPELPDPAAVELPPRVIHRPRLRYGRHLVLGRRRWTVPSELFPRRETGEGDLDYLLRVDRWRRRHGIPRELFACVFPRAGGAAAPDGGEADGAERREHTHKPQYVDFANPLLVDLFTRSVEGLDRFVAQLYERLPDREHLVAAGGERFVTELVVQVDLRRDPADASPRGERGADAG